MDIEETGETEEFTPVVFTCSIPSYLIGRYQFANGIFRAKTPEEAESVRKLAKMIPMPKVLEVNREAAESAVKDALTKAGGSITQGGSDSSNLGANGVTEVGTKPIDSQLGEGVNPPGDTGVKPAGGLNLGLKTQ